MPDYPQSRRQKSKSSRSRIRSSIFHRALVREFFVTGAFVSSILLGIVVFTQLIRLLGDSVSGALAVEGKKFDFRTNERLYKALELKLFEDQKDSIKLTTLVSNVVDRETQEKIDVVKERMIRNYGYCEVCATDVLNFVASIFARGDAKN